MTTTTAVLIGSLAVLAIVLIAVFARRSRRNRAAAQDRYIPYTRALGCLIEGRKEDALGFLKEAVRQNPDDARVYMKLGDLLREKGEVDRALQVHRELTIRKIGDTQMERELYRSLAKDYISAGRYGEAQKAAERVLSLNKKDGEALEVLAQALEGNGDWDKSYEVQEELVRLRKRDGSAFLALYKSYIGSGCLSRGDKARSKKYFESALHKDKNCLPALLYLGDIHYEEGDRKRAIEKWTALTSRFPQWAYIVYGRLEKAYYESGTFGEIERVYEDVLRAKPDDIPTLLAMAEIESLSLGGEGVARAPGFYRRLAGKVRAAYNRHFWDGRKGRHIGCIDIEGARHDYGFTFVNLEAMAYGLADPEQVRRIYHWMETEPTSTGKADTYTRWVFAPRANTVHNPMRTEPQEPVPSWWHFNWRGTPYGDQCQDGGAILYTSFYDLWARARYLGAENAWTRFQEILARYREPDRLSGGPPLFRGEHPQQESPGAVGVDLPFPESGLVPAAALYVFMGVEPHVDGLHIQPRLPASLKYLGVRNLAYRGRRLDLRVGRRSAQVWYQEGGEYRYLRLKLGPGQEVVWSPP